RSTLYTILAGGLLDYPAAGEPMPVVGLTTSEIEARLAARIKLDEPPRVVVGVREYNSHTVYVSGLVNAPGTKVLRREAVPLYVLMADAQPKPEAGRAVVTSPTGRHRIVALDDVEAMNLLIHPADVVTVQGHKSQFFYVGGEVKQPGEKVFRSGITLTQAVLIAGGRTRAAGNIVELVRKGVDGLLVRSRYDIRDINSGKVPDPLVEPGDRIEMKN
ncbi:MAG: SLBB domain-containing protein, partial [Pyrinomonadaceae bacterium]